MKSFEESWGEISNVKKNVRCLIGIFIAVAMSCRLNGCSDAHDNGDDGQVAIEVEAF